MGKIRMYSGVHKEFMVITKTKKEYVEVCKLIDEGKTEGLPKAEDYVAQVEDAAIHWNNMYDLKQIEVDGIKKFLLEIKRKLELDNPKGALEDIDNFFTKKNEEGKANNLTDGTSSLLKVD